MKRTAIAAAALLAITALPVLAGGNPEHVAYPEGYADSFSHYATVNRANGTQVAKLFANDTAIESHKTGDTAASGSVIVMEIYPAVVDDAGDAVVGDDGLFERKDLAAIAVMQKSDGWPAEFSADTRAGDWAFALYDTAGMAKDNSLECYTCHVPFEEQDYMYTTEYLAAHADGN